MNILFQTRKIKDIFAPTGDLHVLGKIWQSEVKGVGALLPQWEPLFRSGSTAQSKKLRSRETSDVA